MILLRTLGTLDLRNSQGSELRAILAQPRRLALLAYLAAAVPRGFHRRDKLLTLFWSDQPTERARASLNRAVYFLRRELGQGILLSRGAEEIGLDSERFFCDAATFEDALEHHRYREALELYRGDILPGFFVSDAPGFEEWLESERARLKERASAAAWTLADEHEKAGNLAGAAQWARRGVELSPFREVGLRRLLELLDHAGDRASAGLAYQQFERQIAAELELSPSPETRELIGAIRSRDQPNGFRDVADSSTESRRESAHDPPSGVQPTSPASVRTHGRRRVHRLTRFAAAAVVLGLSTLVLAQIWRPGLDPARVYVAPFESISGELALEGLGRRTADRIMQSLQSTGLVEVTTPRTNGVASHGKTAASGSVHLASSEPRAGTVVSGELYAESGRIHLQAWITDARRRRVVWAVQPVFAPADSADRAIDEVSRRVAGAVAALSMPRFASWFPIASVPPTFEAFQEFAHADELQFRGADSAALKHLERAVALDPTFKWAELQLVAAHLNLLDYELAFPMIDALDRDRERLSPLQRHWLDWMIAIKAEDLTAGYQAISAAARLAPARFLLDVARRASALNRPRDAIDALERLGPDSPYNGGTTAYWRWLTRAYHGLGDFEGELATARRARKYPASPIAARSLECVALAALGRIHEVRALVDTALTLPTDRGTSPRQLMTESGTSPAQLMVLCAEELRAHGFEQAAMELLARALAWYRAQPADAMSNKGRRLDVAWAHYYARDWQTAEAILRSLVAQDSGYWGSFVFHGLLGTVAARRGDQATARQILARFDTLRTTLPDPHTSVGYWQAKISVLLGDDERAMTLLAESLGPQGRWFLHTDFDFERVWHTKTFRDFIRPKE